MKVKIMQIINRIRNNNYNEENLSREIIIREMINPLEDILKDIDSKSGMIDDFVTRSWNIDSLSIIRLTSLSEGMMFLISDINNKENNIKIFITPFGMYKIEYIDTYCHRQVVSNIINSIANGSVNTLI